MSEPRPLEAVPDADSPEFGEFEFYGETFRFNPGEDYQWEMLEFAEAATSGADTELLSGMAATMALLKAAIHADDWPRFRSLAKKNKAQVRENLMPVVVAAFQQKTRRPTVRPSDSSGGPQIIPPSSEVDSYSRVVKRLEAQGRPELAYMVTMANESSSAA